MLGLALLQCGGDRPSAPSLPPSPPPAYPPGTTLTVVSGETEQPVGGASVSLGGRNYQTDPSGRVSLAEGVIAGTPLEIESAAFLTRHTLVRSAGTTRFSLWPRATPSGISEHYTATLVYTSTSEGAGVGAAVLQRLSAGTSHVALVLSPELQVASGEHQSAADMMTAASGGRVLYTLASERPPGSGIVVFDVRLDPQDSFCANARGVTYVQTAANEIRGGRIVYCLLEAARSPTVAHELGHSFGLRHSPDPQDLMGVPFSRFRRPQLGPRELLIMSLMLQRPGGNRFPDYDREAQVSLGGEEVVFVCS